MTGRLVFSRPGLVSSALLSAVIASGCRGCSVPPGPQTGIIVAIDYSKSFAPLDDQDATALGAVSEAVRELMLNRLDPPVKLYFTTIGTSGLKPLEPCGPAVLFQLSILPNLNPVPGLIKRQKDLQDWLGMCKDRLVALSKTESQSFTALTDVLVFASENLSAVRKDRILVIFSDFREDVPAGVSQSSLHLQGERVALIWRPGRDDKLGDPVIRQRVERLLSALKQNGASLVCAYPARGLTAADLTKCLVAAQP